MRLLHIGTQVEPMRCDIVPTGWHNTTFKHKRLCAHAIIINTSSSKPQAAGCDSHFLDFPRVSLPK